MHCSLDTEVSIFITVILNSLLNKSHKSVSLGSVSGHIMYSFVWNIFADFSFSLTLCVGPYKLHKESTSPKLYGLALYIRPSPISPIRDSGAPRISILSLPKEKQAAVAFFYFLCAEWVAMHLPVETAISILPQIARLCQTHQRSKTGNTDASSLGSPGEVVALNPQIISSISRSKLKVEMFHLPTLWWSGWEDLCHLSVLAIISVHLQN